MNHPSAQTVLPTPRGEGRKGSLPAVRLGRILFALIALLVAGFVFRVVAWPSLAAGRRSVAERVAQYGEAARGRLKPHFTNARVKYPPASLVLAGLKDEKRLEVYAKDAQGKPKFVRAYRILAASGQRGPNLREGDRQVPEGIYAIESLNPNSRFHLSLRIGYPNAFDKEQARLEGRTDLGGGIMIHGNAVSIGCLAMGDEAAEDLFVLAADTGLRNIKVILSPQDFRRKRRLPAGSSGPRWIESVYDQVEAALKELPNPPL